MMVTAHSAIPATRREDGQSRPVAPHSSTTPIRKIASELACATNPNNIEVAIANFAIAFDAVVEVLFDKVGSEVEQSSAPVSDPVAALQRELGAQPTKTWGVEVVGTQHGDLPAWLQEAAAKAGVAKVWDNRDKAVGTKKPWFRQAGVDSADAIPFWPPKGA